MKEVRFLKYGVLGGVLASACCWGPLLLISLGLIGTSGALTIGYRSPWFLTVGIVFTVVVIGLYIRKKLIKKTCATKSEYFRMFLITLGMIGLMYFTTYLLKDVLVPYLAPIVFGNL